MFYIKFTGLIDRIINYILSLLYVQFLSPIFMVHERNSKQKEQDFMSNLLPSWRPLVQQKVSWENIMTSESSRRYMTDCWSILPTPCSSVHIDCRKQKELLSLFGNHCPRRVLIMIGNTLETWRL